MKWIIILISIVAVIIVTAYDPSILAKNSFLKDMVSHKIVAVLVVILTVTMASVANIHLAISRLKKNLSDRGIDISKEVFSARRELSENAWTLFTLFCILLVVLFVKGSSFGSNEFWLSMCHSAAIVILVVNLVILYDIYSSVYELTSLDGPGVHGGQGDDGSELMNGTENSVPVSSKKNRKKSPGSTRV